MSLRRFVFSTKAKCSGSIGYHDASIVIGRKIKDHENIHSCMDRDFPHNDPRWPTKCEHCDYVFQEDDEWQYNEDTLYRRTDTKELLCHLRRSPPGAMWYADWLHFRGPDGHCLVVMTPGGEWTVDSQAKNCTKKDDYDHRCWCRHGEVPLITVDKKCNTCKAGGGSIQAGSFHGFLRNGYLEYA